MCLLFHWLPGSVDLGEVLDCQLEWATGSWATMVTMIDWRLLCIITQKAVMAMY